MGDVNPCAESNKFHRNPHTDDGFHLGRHGNGHDLGRVLCITIDWLEQGLDQPLRYAVRIGVYPRACGVGSLVFNVFETMHGSIMQICSYFLSRLSSAGNLVDNQSSSRLQSRRTMSAESGLLSLAKSNASRAWSSGMSYSFNSRIILRQNGAASCILWVFNSFR